MASRRTALFSSDDARLAARARALGHPARLRILRLLAARGGCICGDIVSELPLTQATVSQHLKILREAGLIEGTIDGVRMCYCLNEAELRGLAERLGNLFESLDGRAMTPTGCCSPVRDKYAKIATREALCCGDGCSMIGDAYDGVDGYVADADLGLGCGLPTEHAGLELGQTVLDLGSGAGLDAFVARRIVGSAGRVIGLDFTPEMIEQARANARSLAYDNVEFHEGDILRMPFEDASADVILSNCVLNLVPDKPKAFAEMYRVLRAGGHFSVSDVVREGSIPEAALQAMERYVGCTEGAMERAAYLDALAAAGFRDITVVTERPIEIPAEVIEGTGPFGGAVLSVTVTGAKA